MFLPVVGVLQAAHSTLLSHARALAWATGSRRLRRIFWLERHDTTQHARTWASGLTNKDAKGSLHRAVTQANELLYQEDEAIAGDMRDMDLARRKVGANFDGCGRHWAPLSQHVRPPWRYFLGNDVHIKLLDLDPKWATDAACVLGKRRLWLAYVAPAAATGYVPVELSVRGRDLKKLRLAKLDTKGMFVEATGRGALISRYK